MLGTSVPTACSMWSVNILYGRD